MLFFKTKFTIIKENINFKKRIELMLYAMLWYPMVCYDECNLQAMVRDLYVMI